MGLMVNFQRRLGRNAFYWVGIFWVSNITPSEILHKNLPLATGDLEDLSILRIEKLDYEMAHLI